MGSVTSRAATPTPPRNPGRPWVPTPFTRLARTHAFSVAGDTLFTAAMAGTVFFSVADFDAARSRVALLLIFTIAPFAVAAPLLGPLLDRARGGRRWMMLGIAVARAVLCILIIRHRDSWLFFVEALLFLVLSKGYLITRGALVPTTVRNDAELVKANSRLALLSGITAAVTAGPAVLLLWLGGASWVLALGAVAFAGCAIAATQLPLARVAPTPADAVEIAELRSVGILVAASSMGTVRFIVGFLVFQVGFYAKDNGQPLLIVAAAVGAQLGFLAGSVASPGLRRTFSEERILAIVLAFTIAAGLVASAVGLLASGSAVVLGLAATLLSAAVGATSNVGKQAFDAIVQRDAPDANRGRSFARFETRFQLVWVVGALIPTAVVFPLEVSFVLVSALAAFALLSYLLGRRRAAAGEDHRLVRMPRRSATVESRSFLLRLGFRSNGGPGTPNGGTPNGGAPDDRGIADGASGPAPGAAATRRPGRRAVDDGVRRQRRADDPSVGPSVGPSADPSNRPSDGPPDGTSDDVGGTGRRPIDPVPELPSFADTAPMQPSPADTGELGLAATQTPGPGDPLPDVGDDAGGRGLFDDGDTTGSDRVYSLDPRRVLDPTVSLVESGVRPGRYLGFLDDTVADQPDAAAPADAPAKRTSAGSGSGRPSAQRRRRRRRRRRGNDQTLPGFDDQ
jgi:MFS family permease